MNEKNFDWNDLKLFIAVARHGGLSGGARATGSSPATLGRRMRLLERMIGGELFHRKARGYELTTDGRALFERALEIEARIASLAAGGEGAKTLVKLSAGQWTFHALSAHIGAITAAAPDARLRLISSDEYLNVNRREAVIAIRNQRPYQPGLAGRKVGDVSFAAYAADPSVECWIAVAGQTPSAQWLAGRRDAPTAMEVNSPLLAKDMAEQGAGRVVLPCFIGDRSASLVRVSDPIGELDHEQWLVSHDADRFIPPVRRTLDAVYDALRAAIRKTG